MAAKRARRSSVSTSKLRASWQGQLRFGLVSFEVQALNAEIRDRSGVQFHMLHEPDHQRIRYVKVCPVHGEVPNDEIVKGYEYAKGEYIEFDKEELSELQSDKDRALLIDTFVSSNEIDPIYFDGRTYYLLPAGNSATEPYSLLATAMEKQKRWGIGQVIFSGREQLAVVRPLEGVLIMAMLNYDAELRKPEDILNEFTPAKTTPKNLRLAEELIDKWQAENFDLSTYEDHYRERLTAAIAAKQKGKKPPTVQEEEEPEVINLMEALQKSVAAASKSTVKRRASKTKSRPAKRKAKRKGA